MTMDIEDKYPDVFSDIETAIADVYRSHQDLLDLEVQEAIGKWRNSRCDEGPGSPPTALRTLLIPAG